MREFRIAFVLHVLCSLNGYGQVSDSISADSVQLNEVEVKAMYSNFVSRRFPASVYTIDSIDKDLVSPINITESLNKIPSVFAHTGTLNTSRITMRGIGTRSLYGTRKINALLNDIPLTSGEGDTFIDDIDLQIINNIEVIGGPTAGIYGPALGGTILLSTGEAKNSKSINLNSGIGSFGTIQNLMHAEIGNGISRVSVALKNSRSDSYRDNNSFNRNVALFNFSSSIKKFSFNAVILYTGIKAEIPSSIDSTSFENKPWSAASTWAKTNGRENASRLLGGLNYRFDVNPNLFLEGTIYGLYKKSEEVRPFDFLNEEDKAGGIKFRAKKKIGNIPGLSVTPGFSLFFEAYSPQLFENLNGLGQKGLKTASNVEHILQGNVYTVFDFVPDLKHLLSLSLNISKLELKDENIFKGFAPQKYSPDPYFSPRASFSRRLTLNHFAFLNISHGLSYPSIQEILFPYGTLNKTVKPEKAWSFEAGLKGVQLFNEVKYSLSVYLMYVKDLIVPDRIAEDTYVGKNIGKSRHSGIELSAQKSRPLNQNSWFYLADYNVTYNLQSNKFGHFLHDTLNLQGNMLPGVPNQRVFLSLMFRIKKLLFVEPELIENGKMAMNDANSKFYHSYNLVNIQSGMQLQKKNFNLRLAFRVNNLFEKKYASMILINAPSVNGRQPRYYYPGNPRNIYISVSFGFNL